MKKNKKKNRVHVHKGDISKVVHIEELDDYLSQGYKLGRAKFSDEALSNIRESRKKFFEENPNWTNNTSFKVGHNTWNKGLTKETDDRVRVSAEHFKESRPAGYHYDKKTKENKFKKEKITREKNFGSVEKSYETAVSKSLKTREQHREQDPEFNKKIWDKTIATIVDKYGSLDEFYSRSINNRNKTIGDKYNSLDEYYKFIYEKQCETKRKNGTCIGGSSKLEDYIYGEILKKFDVNDVERWYDKDDRYPWHCDFYIKSIDLFIELNGYWTHGKHPFNKNLQDDLDILHEWESKCSTYINNKGYETKNQFYSAIEIWTVIDPLKQKMAKENKLNYITLYNKEDINDFITRIQNDSIKEQYKIQ